MNENIKTTLKKDLINLTYRIMVLSYLFCSFMCGMLMLRNAEAFSNIIGVSQFTIEFIGAVTLWYSLLGTSSCPQIIESIQQLRASFNALINQISHR
jgi:hypothetical protein